MLRRLAERFRLLHHYQHRPWESLEYLKSFLILSFDLFFSSNLMQRPHQPHDEWVEEIFLALGLNHCNEERMNVLHADRDVTHCRRRLDHCHSTSHRHFQCLPLVAPLVASISVGLQHQCWLTKHRQTSIIHFVQAKTKKTKLSVFDQRLDSCRKRDQSKNLDINCLASNRASVALQSVTFEALSSMASNVSSIGSSTG